MSFSVTMAMSLDSPLPGTDTEEAGWVASSLEGDHRAFAELIHLHQRRVFRLVGRLFRRPEDVEELAQETFLTAWQKLGTYKAKAPFEHWLTRVCLNCCYARLRKEKPSLPLEQELTAERRDPDAALEVERLLLALPAADRFVLLLLDGEGWSVAEIAQRIGWTRANVKVRAHRARKKLRQFLEQR